MVVEVGSKRVLQSVGSIVEIFVVVDQSYCCDGST